MEQFNQQHPGGQQAFPQTNQQEKQLIAILGVQGLSYQNYSVLELKIVLQIIKHAQKAILGYVIPYQVTSQTFNGFTAEQRAADHTDVIMKLSEFPYGAHHYPQLRDAIKRIESQPILLPFKLEKQTLYRKFACLFKSEIYQDRHKNWMVKFRFDNNVIRFFYSFDKGVSRYRPQCHQPMPQRIEHQVISHHELLGCKGIHHLQNGAYPATDAWQGRLLQDLVGTGQQMSDFCLQRPQAPLPEPHHRPVSYL